MRLITQGFAFTPDTENAYTGAGGSMASLSAMVNIVFGAGNSIFYPEMELPIPRAPFIPRRRKPMTEIFRELGPSLTRRAYRMTEESFWSLYSILEPFLKERCSSETNSESSKKNHRNGAKNGLIPLTTRLSVAIRFYAGGRPEDIMLVHGISFGEVYHSVWLVADAINSCSNLAFRYPDSHTAQRAVATEFEKKSKVNFKCCAGAIDCMLLWLEKPEENCCEEAKVGSKKFYCGRKKKFGLCMQAVADAHSRFLDVSIGHPGSTGDFLAFSTSSVFYKLEKPSFLASGLCLFGDNAYVNTRYMATPYKSVKSGAKDDYNFYHSQIQINIECSFGMLVGRWGILRRALPARMGMSKITSLVMCLCRLHNFCINERIQATESGSGDGTVNGVPPLLLEDEVEITANGGIPLERNSLNNASPEQLLHGGEHFDEFSRSSRRHLERQARLDVDGELPRETLLYQVAATGLRRPTPTGWRTQSS